MKGVISWRLSYFIAQGALLFLFLRPPPENPLPPLIPHLDKLAHFGGHFLLTFLFLKSWKLHFWKVAGWFFAHGMLIEIIQPYFHRSFEWADMFFNGLGVLSGIYLFQNFQSKVTGPDNQRP